MLISAKAGADAESLNPGIRETTGLAGILSWGGADCKH